MTHQALWMTKPSLRPGSTFSMQALCHCPYLWVFRGWSGKLILPFTNYIDGQHRVIRLVPDQVLETVYPSSQTFNKFKRVSYGFWVLSATNLLITFGSRCAIAIWVWWSARRLPWEPKTRQPMAVRLYSDIWSTAACRHPSSVTNVCPERHKY